MASAPLVEPVVGAQKFLVVGCRYADPTAPNFLDQAGSGIVRILDQLHLYFDIVSNARMDFQGEFTGWHDLPLTLAADSKDGLTSYAAAQAVAGDVLHARGQTMKDYRAVVLLFDIDGTWGSFTKGQWVRLRFSGGQGGWTSLATWVHELGHAIGLEHTTYLARQDGNQYSDVQTPMSGFSHVSQHHWWFDQPYVCNGVTNNMACITPGQQDQVPCTYAAFELDQLSWLAADQIVDHWGGFGSYDLSAPTYNPANEPTLERVKLVKARIPGTDAYYAIEYRRGDDGADANSGAFLRGWTFYELGLLTDRVTVYYVNPAWHALDDDLGDAILLSVLTAGGSFTASPDWPSLSVRFVSVPDSAHMHGTVTVATPLPPGPETSIALPLDYHGWYSGPVSLTLPHTTVAAPFATTYYGVDDPGCTPDSRACAVYGGPVTVSGEGVHQVVAFSTDVLGDAGPVVQASVSIDLTPPVTTASITVSTAGAVVTLTAGDALSGVATTEAAVDGGAFALYTAPLVITTPGAHSVLYRSRDVAGNGEATRTAEVVVPSLPLHATAVATPSVLTPADRRRVPVHIDIRADEAPGLSATLVAVTRVGGKGRSSGWSIGTADFDGFLTATPGATYHVAYNVTDASGRQTRAVATVNVV